MNKKKQTNRRIIVILAMILVLFLVLLFRTFYIQYVDSPELSEKAQKIYSNLYELDPIRGNIYDRNNNKLAYNGKSYTVIAILSKDNSMHIKDPTKVADSLAPILNMSEIDLYKLLTKDAYQVELRPGGWKIDQQTADKIKELNLPGIILKEDSKRYYPYNTLASYVLGFVDYGNKAVLGIESYYNDLLLGTSGELNVMEDSKGYKLPGGEVNFNPPINGKDIVLTIDKTIQQYVESALDEAERKYSPKSMVAIAADPNTGEILAMSSRPNYNPNEYWNIEEYKNYAVSYNFEPGSTFKIITLAAAIEENLFNSNDTFMSGKIKVPGGTIKDANYGHGWGEISYLEGVQRSSNVAFVKIGYEMLGKDLLFSYIDKFGFGKKTGIDLPSESVGIMKDSANAYPLDVAAISFGQGVAVTPIQQVMAVSAVANGGTLITPHIVKEIRDFKTDEVIVKKEPIIQSQVISEATSKKVNSILEEVVKFGQKPGYIEGYHVAGKTGTAQKVGSNGKYIKDKYVVSYIGYAPANDPKILVYVVVDEPSLDIPYYGSTIAAPIFKEIMQNSLRYLKVPIDIQKESTSKENSKLILKSYVDTSAEEAKKELEDMGLTAIVLGDGKKVFKQMPGNGELVSEGTNIYLVTSPEKGHLVPDLIGKSLRDAVEYCTVLNIKYKIEGSGIVVSQSIEPDTLYDGELLIISLKDPTETTEIQKTEE